MRTMSILLILVAGGCSANYTQPELFLSNPATPAADAAPPSLLSHTLSRPSAGEPAPAGEAPPESPHQHHHPGSDRPSPSDAPGAGGAHP